MRNRCGGSVASDLAAMAGACATASLGQGPVAFAGFSLQLGTAFDGDPQDMKPAGFGGFWLEGEDVLAVDFLADQLDGLLESVLLQESESPAAGGSREEDGEVRFIQAQQLAESVQEAAGAEVGRYRCVVGLGAHRAFRDLDPLRFRFEI